MAPKIKKIDTKNPNASNDERAPEDGFKFICGYKMFHFILPHIEEDGYHSDAHGNGKLPNHKYFHFKGIPVKDPETGLTSTKLGYSIFICDPKKYPGGLYERIYNHLMKLRENPDNKLYSDEEYFRKRNPEAYGFAKREAEMQAKIDEKDDRIRELEMKLGIKR